MVLARRAGLEADRNIHYPVKNKKIQLVYQTHGAWATGHDS